MKRWLIYLLVLLVMVGCASKKHVNRSHTTITREFDSLVKIPGRKAMFLPVTNDTTETLTDRKTGIRLIIKREPDPDILGFRKVTSIEVEDPEREILMKGKETRETERFDKNVEGVPWFYKAALFLVIVIIIFLIVKYLL